MMKPHKKALYIGVGGSLVVSILLVFLFFVSSLWTFAYVQFVLFSLLCILTSVGIICACLSIYEVYLIRRLEILETGQKEAAVHDCYMYHELFDPSNMNT